MPDRIHKGQALRAGSEAMKLQTSLEFLLILSAVAALSLGVLSLYGKALSFNRQVSAAFDTANLPVENTSLPYAADPGIAINVPVNSIAMSSNPIMVEAYGCSNGIERVVMSSSNAVLSQKSILANFSGLELKYFYFDPENPGIHGINISYSITCNNSTISGNRSYLTYSVPSPSAPAPASGASISIKYLNESIIYPVQKAGIDYIQGFNLCTQRNIWSGYVYPSAVQCGTSSSWDYMTFDGSCEAPDWSYSRTYCFVPAASGYNAIIPETDNASYAYAISVSINTEYGQASFNLSSSNPFSAVALNGAAAGSATVENITSEASPPPIVLEGPDNGIYSGGTYSYYQSYEDSAYQVLHFYNSTGASPSTSSSIQEAVSAANSGANGLLGNLAKQVASPCLYHGSSYICKAKSPFSYVINVTIDNASVQGDTIMPYYGSVINLIYR